MRQLNRNRQVLFSPLKFQSEVSQWRYVMVIVPRFIFLANRSRLLLACGPQQKVRLHNNLRCGSNQSLYAKYKTP